MTAPPGARAAIYVMLAALTAVFVVAVFDWTSLTAPQHRPVTVASAAIGALAAYAVWGAVVLTRAVAPLAASGLLRPFDRTARAGRGEPSFIRLARHRKSQEVHGERDSRGSR
jgi:hypothetical protein